MGSRKTRVLLSAIGLVLALFVLVQGVRSGFSLQTPVWIPPTLVVGGILTAIGCLVGLVLLSVEEK